MAETTWLDQKHPEYDRIAEREVYTWDHYTGEALDKARDKARDMKGSSSGFLQVTIENMADRIRELFRKGDPSAPYLIRRSQGEQLAQYYERLMISRFPRHFAKIVGSIVGSINQVESKAKRSWGELGDPDDPESFMYGFWRNADGRGTNYQTMLNQALTRLVTSHRLWYGLDPDPIMPRTLMFDTTAVEDWLETEEGRLVETKVREQVDVRESVKTETEKDKAYVDNWMVYTVEGFERWERNEGEPVMKGDLSGTWDVGYFTDSTQRRGRLPVGRVEAALSLEAGYRVAQSCNALFNLLSDARNILRVANHPRLRGKDVTAEQWEMIEQDILKGGNTLLGDFAFINPDPSNASTAYDIYKEEVREVYVEAFQTYEDAARERTATEITTDDSRGRRSILAVFADALDEFENDLLFLIEQTLFPNRPDAWGQAFVERSKDFKPIDPEETADRIVREIFGGVAPEFPAEAQVEFMKKVLEGYGIEFEDMYDKLREVVGLAAIERRQETAQDLELAQALNGLPA